MQESEDSVRSHASAGAEPVARVCNQLIASSSRYTRWLSFHDRSMTTVSSGKMRDLQILKLRLVATEQIHRAALVRYLHDNQLTGKDREGVLREFYGALEIQNAVLAEHRLYSQAVSSQVSALDLLDLCGDRNGANMARQYQYDYGVYFSMHCDRARAQREQRRYLLASLIPEVKATAVTLRRRILEGDALPIAPAFVRVA